MLKILNEEESCIMLKILNEEEKRDDESSWLKAFNQGQILLPFM